MDMTHPLDGAQLKLNRAAALFTELKAAVAQFLNERPFRVELEVDSDRTQLYFVAYIDRPVPLIWSAVISEIVHHLRSALDYLIYELTIKATQRVPGRLEKTQFPVVLLRKDFAQEAQRYMPNVHTKVRTIVENAQPFMDARGHQTSLWYLQQISNWDKHRSIVLGGIARNDFVFDACADGFEEMQMAKGRLQHGRPVAGIKMTPSDEPLALRIKKTRYCLKMGFMISIDQPSTAEGLNAIELVDAMQTDIAYVLSELTQAWHATE